MTYQDAINSIKISEVEIKGIDYFERTSDLELINYAIIIAHKINDGKHDVCLDKLHFIIDSTHYFCLFAFMAIYAGIPIYTNDSEVENNFGYRKWTVSFAQLRELYQELFVKHNFYFTDIFGNSESGGLNKKIERLREIFNDIFGGLVNV